MSNKGRDVFCKSVKDAKRRVLTDLKEEPNLSTIARMGLEYGVLEILSSDFLITIGSTFRALGSFWINNTD